jgi:acyl-CoA synthetase (AMP-forming)/AMP-acid ligase II
MYHDMGLIGNLLQPLYVGASSVLMSPIAFLQRPIRWLNAISHYRARTSGGPNFGYDLCVRAVTDEQRGALDLSSWEVAYNGAEPIRSETLERFAATFEPCGFRWQAFYPTYGLAESTLFVSGGHWSAPPVLLTVDADALHQHRVVVAEAGQAGPGDRGDAAQRTLVGCGRNPAGSDGTILIVDPESGMPCAPDQVGEIWVSGSHVAQGYWGRPAETARTFRASLSGPDEEPFLRTGDLGFIRDGELFVTGRIKDLIILNGQNHYPEDIELTVETSHPALRPGRCAAFAAERGGQEHLVVAAEVQRHYRPEQLRTDGSDGSLASSRLPPEIDEAIRSIRGAVARRHDASVSEVLLLKPGGIPTTSSGKIQRHACRAGYLAETLDVWWRK